MYIGWQVVLLVNVRLSMTGLEGNGVKGMDNGHMPVCVVQYYLKRLYDARSKLEYKIKCFFIHTV